MVFWCVKSLELVQLSVMLLLLGPCLFMIKSFCAHARSNCACMHKCNQPDAALRGFLQPTIIIDASLNVDIHLLLMNFGTICTCAFLGTTISSFTIGTMQWAFGAAGLAHAMPFLMNLVRRLMSLARMCLPPRAQHMAVWSWEIKARAVQLQIAQKSK